MIDLQSTREAVAIKNSFKPHTMDFGVRKHKSNQTTPDMILHKLSRKRCRHRNPRQTDLRKQKLIILGKELKKRRVFVEVQL